MDGIKDYDESIQILINRIERFFNQSKKANQADKIGQLRSVNNSLQDLKTQLNYFKRELFNIPKSREAEFKTKYSEYQTKVAHYEREAKKHFNYKFKHQKLNVNQSVQAKRLDFIIKGDEKGLLAMEHGLDQQNQKYAQGSMWQHQPISLILIFIQIVRHGLGLQDKSKDALFRIKSKVQDINDLQDVIGDNIDKQNNQILRIDQQIVRMDSTMTRTKRYLTYFGRSFFKDKVAVTFLLLILGCLIGIIIVAILPYKKLAVKSTSGEDFPDNHDIYKQFLQ